MLSMGEYWEEVKGRQDAEAILRKEVQCLAIEIGTPILWIVLGKAREEDAESED